MPASLRRLALAASLALAPAALAQDDAPARTGPAFDLLADAYGVVFDGAARTFDFAVTWTDADTMVTDTGFALAHVDSDTGQTRFSLLINDGESRRIAFDGAAYQVESVRTRKVYVDSTLQEVGSGLDSYLYLHPLMGVGLHVYLQDASEVEVVGDDVENGSRCTVATFRVPSETDEVDVSACFGVTTALPGRLAFTDAAGTLTIRVWNVEAVDVPEPEAFVLDLRPGFERVPYTSDTPLVAVGEPAPAFRLADGAGVLDLADYRGRYVLLDFWGTWCAPCVEAIPHLQEIAETYPDLAVLGLAAYEDDGDDPAAFVRQRGGTYRVARADEPTVDAYRVAAFPTYYLVGPDGRVVWAGVPDREPDAVADLDALLARTFEP